MYEVDFVINGSPIITLTSSIKACIMFLITGLYRNRDGSPGAVVN